MNRKKMLLIAIVAVLVITLLVSGIQIIRYAADSKNQADRMNELSQIVSEAKETTVPTTEAPTEAATEETTVPTEKKPLAEYQEIYDKNSDFVGWLKIDGTKLDYPVLQTPDETDYYLYRNFDKANSTHGSIYAREQCNIDRPSDNITIYGHNMKDGSMFAALNGYVNKKTWEKNSLITFDTLNEYHTYKIFAVFKTSANLGEGYPFHEFVDAANEQEFNDFVKTVKSLSFYDTGYTPKYGDKIISLCTCEYTLDNGRLIVCAYRLT